VSSLAEHVSTLRSSVVALDKAIEAAQERWQVVPEHDTWSPRITAEHIVPAIVIYVDLIGDELGLPPFDWSSLEATFSTAEAARSGLAHALAWDLTVIEKLTDQSLDGYMTAMEDWPDFPSTIGGALQMVARHACQHAEQINEMLAAGPI
jgi:hypothetical protein